MRARDHARPGSDSLTLTLSVGRRTNGGRTVKEITSWKTVTEGHGPGYSPVCSASCVCVGGGGDAVALCNNPRIVSSVYPRGSLSYVYTPGLAPSETASSVSESLQGYFWALGGGQPGHREGLDNGAFLALGERGWVQRPLGYPATIDTTWSAASQIDGCIDDAAAEAGPRCVAVLLSDQAAGQGFYALVTAAPSALGNYSLAQQDNAPLVLAALVSPQLSSAATTPTGASANVRVDAGSGGKYLDPACSTETVVGYRLYAQTVVHAAPAPGDLRRDESHGWTLASGGQPLSFGATTAITSPCAASQDLYLAASLVFDSGFETPHLSRPAGPIRCGGPLEQGG